MAEHDLDELRRIFDRHLGGSLTATRWSGDISQELAWKIKSGKPLSQEDHDQINRSLEWLKPTLLGQYSLGASLQRDLERYYKERGIEPPKPSAGQVHVATIDPSGLVATGDAPRQSGAKKRKGAKRGRKYRLSPEKQLEVCKYYEAHSAYTSLEEVAELFKVPPGTLKGYWDAYKRGNL